MPRHINSVPALPQQEELPAGGVRNLDHQPAVRPQERVRSLEVRCGIVQMFQYMEHCDSGASRWSQGSAGKCPADHGNTVFMPGNPGCFAGKIEPHNLKSAFAQ